MEMADPRKNRIAPEALAALVSEWPARYRMLALLVPLMAVLSALSFWLSDTPGLEALFANLALFSMNAALILFVAGADYVICFWHPADLRKDRWGAALEVAWAAVSYTAGTLLNGLLLFLALTALSGSALANGPDQARFIFVSLSLSLVLIFLARVFSHLAWKRAQDYLFGIVLYNIVIGILFLETVNLNPQGLGSVVSIYLSTFQQAFLAVILFALVVEAGVRRFGGSGKAE